MFEAVFGSSCSDTCNAHITTTSHATVGSQRNYKERTPTTREHRKQEHIIQVYYRVLGIYSCSVCSSASQSYVPIMHSIAGKNMLSRAKHTVHSKEVVISL